LYQTHLRICGGSTKGFGSIKIIDIKTRKFDKTNYSEYSSSLNHKLKDSFLSTKQKSDRYTTYKLTIKPDDFFMFGSGFGDTQVDMTPVYERVIDYDKKALSDEMILIPASSIKGAIVHRTTYNYNLQNKLFIGNDEAKSSITEIFGEAKDSRDSKNNTKKGSKGKVIFSDCYLSKQDTKVFDHVAIDRFTGGAIDGALFQEKTSTFDENFTLEILLEKKIDDKFIKAFEKTLKDICDGMLGLGGMTTKGHGFFSGNVYKDGEKL
jgi:CRISPR/Cas system CSM-associated protein Csm3 (group 7 of RAMP superfamily)